MSWADERARFPVLERYAYLNAGTYGPLSRETLQAMAAVRAWEGDHGRAGGVYFDEMWERRARVRALLAAEIRVPDEHLALVDSTTHGVHTVVAGLGLGPDDEIATTDAEHFGLMGPLIASGARLRIAHVRELAASEVFDAVLTVVTPSTRLIALSAISWLDGKVFPWPELREATGKPVLVDGAQSAGAVEVDAREADFYTVSAQKWLCGPDAMGALYVRDPEALTPRLLAYPAVESYDIAGGAFEPRAGALRFDGAFTPVNSLAGLEAALATLPAGRFERARALAERCREFLLAAGHDVVTEPGQATLVSFRVGGEASAVTPRLYERGVILRDLPGSDLLRASVGWWNDESDLERLVEALKA